MDLWQPSLTVLSTVLLVAAIFFSLKLSRETRGERYWVFFVIAALSMAVFHSVRHPWAASFIPAAVIDMVQEVAEIAGAFSLAYACFGLYYSMKKVRKRISGELEGGK